MPTIPSSPSLPWTSSSSSSPAATTSVVTGTTLHAWEPALYLVVVLIIFAIVCGTILLIWNDDKIKLNCLRIKMESATRHDSGFLFPSASTLIERMFKYFFSTLVPAFRHLRRATTSLGSVAPRRPQPALPLYRPPGFLEPVLATPRPAMPRDNSSFRVQSNPYSGSEQSILPVASSPLIPAFFGPASPPS